jgi:hypothetical protein
MINFIVENWQIIFIAIIVLFNLIYFGIQFFKQDPKKQLEQVKEWLLYAVAAAEKEFGSGTGTLKMKYVYNLFVTTFPSVAKIISYETFKNLAEEALVSFKGILETTPAVKTYIEQ